MLPLPSHSLLVISIKANDTICSADPARNLGVLLDTLSLSHSTFSLHHSLLILSSVYASTCQLFPISFPPILVLPAFPRLQESPSKSFSTQQRKILYFKYNLKYDHVASFYTHTLLKSFNCLPFLLD